MSPPGIVRAALAGVLDLAMAGKYNEGAFLMEPVDGSHQPSVRFRDSEVSDLQTYGKPAIPACDRF